MKKYLAITLIIILLSTLTACRNNTDNNESFTDNTTSGFIDLDIVPEDENANQNNNSDRIESSDKENTEENGSENEENKDSNKENQNNSGSSPNKQNASNSSNEQTGNNKPSSNNTQNNTDNTQNNNKTEDNKPTNNDTENDKKPNGDATDKKPSGDDKDKSDYKDIECRTVTEWKSVELVSNSNTLYLKASIPSDWSIFENGIIKIKNTQVGQITTKLTENFSNIYDEIKSENTLLSDITASSSVREYTVNNEKRYKRIIKISKIVSAGHLLNLFISADYSQLDDSATSKILNSVINNGEYKPSPLLDKNATKNILLLGNNNIENSKIDEYFSALLNAGGKVQKIVSNQPIGGGEVNNFATNTALMEKISNGEYSAVILNGFYKEENTIEPIKTIIDACKRSNCLLILLPAFDDNSEIVNKILSTHNEIFCINWKNEIEKLIATGKNGITTLSSDDFYTNSAESSSELSGYVGASLIFRTIFNENSPTLTSHLPDGYEKIKDYFKSGVIPGESKTEIFFIQ